MLNCTMDTMSDWENSPVVLRRFFSLRVLSVRGDAGNDDSKDGNDRCGRFGELCCWDQGEDLWWQALDIDCGQD